MIMNQSLSQKTFIDILSDFNNIDTNNLVYSFNPTNIGFALDSSFILKKNDFLKTDYKCILITKNNLQFSFWAIFEIQNEKQAVEEHLCLPITSALLFDKINQRLFYIEYAKTKSSSDCSFVFNKDSTIRIYMPLFEFWISKIIELDFNFIPLTGFYTYWDNGYSVGTISKFYYLNDSWYVKTLELNKKYKEILYEDFLNYNNDIIFKDIEYEKCERKYFFPDFYKFPDF